MADVYHDATMDTILFKVFAQVCTSFHFIQSLLGMIVGQKPTGQNPTIEVQIKIKATSGHLYIDHLF